MTPSRLSELLKLPADARPDLAVALWESLSDAEREAEMVLTPEQLAELERRWAEHIEDPASAISWDEVRRRMHGSE
jgi:putative addiction module component (TIGR02574 family)